MALHSVLFIGATSHSTASLSLAKASSTLIILHFTMLQSSIIIIIWCIKCLLALIQHSRRLSRGLDCLCFLVSAFPSSFSIAFQFSSLAFFFSSLSSFYCFFSSISASFFCFFSSSIAIDSELVKTLALNCLPSELLCWWLDWLGVGVNQYLR